MKPMSNSALWAARGRSAHKVQKRRQGLLRGCGASLSMSSVMPVRPMISGVRRRSGVHKGLEPLGDLAVAQHHRADLRDGLPVHLQAGGLDVEADVSHPSKGLILVAVDGDPVVQVVDEIALHAVEDLDLVPGGVPGVREGLGHAVVRDGDGRVAPAWIGLLATDLLGVRSGRPCWTSWCADGAPPASPARCPPGSWCWDRHDVLGVQLDVACRPRFRLHLALDLQPHAGLASALSSAWASLAVAGIFVHR